MTEGWINPLATAGAAMEVTTRFRNVDLKDVPTKGGHQRL